MYDKWINRGNVEVTGWTIADEDLPKAVKWWINYNLSKSFCAEQT